MDYFQQKRLGSQRGRPKHNYDPVADGCQMNKPISTDERDPQEEEDQPMNSHVTEGANHPTYTRSTALASPVLQATNERLCPGDDHESAEPGIQRPELEQVTIRKKLFATSTHQAEPPQVSEASIITQPDDNSPQQEERHASVSGPAQEFSAQPMSLPTKSQKKRRSSRTRTPRIDGKITLLAVIDKGLHARVKNAAKSHGVSLKRMVELMIEHSLPAA